MVRRVLSILLAAFALTACGGGSGGGGSLPAPVPSTPAKSPTPVATPPPPPGNVAASQSLGAAGGSVTASNGAVSGTVTFPAGELASNATVSLTVFDAASFPRTLQSLKRSTLSIPTGGTLLGGFIVDTGGVAITSPLQLKLVTAAPASGLVIRLAGSLSNASFFDVDTATAASGAVTNDGYRLTTERKLCD